MRNIVKLFVWCTHKAMNIDKLGEAIWERVVMLIFKTRSVKIMFFYNLWGLGHIERPILTKFNI